MDFDDAGGRVNSNIQNWNVVRNWKTSLLGMASAVLAVIQISGAHSIQAAVLDGKTQIAMLIAVLGFVSKDGSMTGTAANPRAVNQGDATPGAKP